MRWWTDAQFLIVALHQLLRAARLAASAVDDSNELDAAIARYTEVLPAITMLRDVGAHFDEYARDQGERWQGQATRRDLQVGSWDGTTFHWLGAELKVNVALQAAESLHEAVWDSGPTGKQSIKGRPRYVFSRSDRWSRSIVLAWFKSRLISPTRLD